MTHTFCESSRLTNLPFKTQLGGPYRDLVGSGDTVLPSPLTLSVDQKKTPTRPGLLSVDLSFTTKPHIEATDQNNMGCGTQLPWWVVNVEKSKSVLSHLCQNYHICVVKFYNKYQWSMRSHKIWT